MKNSTIIRTRFTFSKTERLKSHKLIARLFSEGKSFVVTPLRILYQFSPLQSNLQSGFAVSAKKFKRAVDRNRVKRLMRETYRLQKNDLRMMLKERGKCMCVFFIYTGNEIPEYKQLVEKMQFALARLQKIVNESAVENS